MKWLRIAVVLLATATMAAPVMAEDDASASEAAPSSTVPHTSSRAVLPRDLMTREERAAFRAQMQQATPQERNAIWHRELAILEQRAAARGVGLAVPAMRPDGTFYPHEIHGNGPARWQAGGVRAP
jgi:hypothetical protein